LHYHYSFITCAASADEKTDHAYMAALYYTVTERVVWNDSPEDSTLLDAGSSVQTNKTYWRTSMADFVTQLKPANSAAAELANRNLANFTVS